MQSVRVNIPGKRVYLAYDPATISLDTVSTILDEEGYAVESSTSA